MGSFSKTIKIRVPQSDINEGKCNDPNHCMLKLAIKRAIGGHGYVHVEGGVVSLTRRPDYREKGFLPRTALNAMLLFDENKDAVRPFTFTLTLHKSSKIVTRERQEQINAVTRKLRKAPGYKSKKYNMRKRIAGIAYGGPATAQQ